MGKLLWLLSISLMVIAMNGAIPQADAMSIDTPSMMPVKTIQWAGHTWDVTDYTNDVFTSDNVWVDICGRLHMKLIYDGKWHDFNLIQQEKVGYGTYRWTLASDVDYIQDRQNGGNPYFVFSPFLFDSSNPQQNYGEIDIEMCKWGADHSNTDWTIHSANHKVQSNHFVGAGNTWTLEWTPDHVRFSVEGPGQPYKEYMYTDRSGIARDTGNMMSLLHIGQFNDYAPPGNLTYYEAEVVLSEYTFTPYTGTKSQGPVSTPASTQTSTAKPQPALMSGTLPTITTIFPPVSFIQRFGEKWEIPDQRSQMLGINNTRAGLDEPLQMNLKWPLSR